MMISWWIMGGVRLTTRLRFLSSSPIAHRRHPTFGTAWRSAADWARSSSTSTTPSYFCGPISEAVQADQVGVEDVTASNDTDVGGQFVQTAPAVITAAGCPVHFWGDKTSGRPPRCISTHGFHRAVIEQFIHDARGQPSIDCHRRRAGDAGSARPGWRGPGGDSGSPLGAQR